MVDLASLFLSNAISLVIVIPLMGGFLAGIFARVNKKLVYPLALLALLLSAFFAGVLAHQVRTEGVVARALESDDPGKIALTLPSGYVIPVRIVLVADGMSVLMTLIASVISVLALIYSFSFIKRKQSKFYPLFLLMVAGVYGMVLTGDLFNMFVFLEILSISSCGLIVAFDRRRAPDSALKFLIISTLAAMIFLVGVGILYGQYDALNLAFLADNITGSALDKIALGLLFTALAMKAGAVPMHMWVPDAYAEAPASVTAFLATGSLASLYALFRVCFTLFGFSINSWVVGSALIVLGVVSMIVGALMALTQNNIKRVIAFQSVAQVGFMLLAVGVGLSVINTPSFQAFGIRAMEGGLFHVLNHILYDALLFFCAGAIFYAVNTTDLREMGGLGHKLPLTMFFFLIGALSISGIPPLNGFASKILIYESVYAFSPVLSALAVLISILTLAAFMKVLYSAFMGPVPDKKVYHLPRTMLGGMIVLSLLCVLFGLFPGVILDSIVRPAVEALINVAAYTGVIGIG